MAKDIKAKFSLTRQPTPVFEPEPLPGQTPAPTFGVHPHSVYEKARINQLRTSAEDEVAMRRLKEVSGRLQKPETPQAEPSTARMLPGFTGQGAEFKRSKLEPFTPKIPKVEATKAPARGADWGKMTVDERSSNLANLEDIQQKSKFPMGVPKRVNIPVTEVVKDASPASVPKDLSRMVTRSIVPHYMDKELTMQSDVDTTAKESTGLDLPAPKVRTPSIRAAIKKVAESVAERHYSKNPEINVESGEPMDIKQHAGSALGYFKKTFTKNGTNEEVEKHVIDNYSHMLPEEYKREPEPKPRAATPAAPSRSREFVKSYLNSPLSAFKDK